MMKLQQTSIIPVDQIFYNENTNELVDWSVNNISNNLDLKAITSFCSMGFMLDNNTFFNEIKVLLPSTKITIDNNIIINKCKTWDWYYNPTESSFNNILEGFTDIFEKIIINSTKERRILLPLSDGLDSRSLFASVKDKSNFTLASYEFEGGIEETETAKALSQRFNIPLFIQKIQKGYLWNKPEDCYKLNNCFTDFTHPRQVDVIHQWKELGDVILLGHWGDVLFDKQADSDNINYDEQVIQLKKKILISGGVELAADLWRHWGFEGSFETHITGRLDRLYKNINIDHPSARMRAFKSLYWAPRWTSINLSIFKKAGEIILPYYSDEMCKFICTVPERYLKGRKIQIEYIKKQCPEAARIPWQKYYPLNLYKYQRFNHPHYYVLRAFRKTKIILQQYLSKSPDLIIRNWELQFLGEQNFTELKKNLLANNKFNKLIPQNIIRKYLDKFQTNPVKYSHPVSMLLTLSVFSARKYQE